ncbi:carbohydrate ABC transporter permease [Pseudoroseicyclus aestuarii]|uniref:Carbohydrate ABC transporter membrane protein 1 (CUT1 family) n=1 Tax=Pseudoroseicyclus aestuarii TaxID=1795041 RepID=A0A318SRL1_9RHOB|nr:sugar ABC transporter permease [Pseudoroseicyclus aestuarii]PYE84242.1 carbohydrate ABC transporter membrane protein 1 (CUT1 family) [Pseudoroseicyclus aestuarii]
MTAFATRLGAAVAAPFALLARAIDLPLRGWQRLTGMGGMAAVFLAPNLAIFGVFVLIPLALNFAYSMTGGTDILLPDRPFVGADQYARLLDCADYSRAVTCREDAFWTAARNTAVFVVFQVSLMVAVSMITALILNRKIAGRGFFRAVFFFPVLLSPVVVGLIWRWILQRQGLLNLIVVNLGFDPQVWLNDRLYAFAAAVGVSTWAHMGFYTLILLAGLQAIPRDLYEAAEMDGTKPGRVFRRITLPLLGPNLAVVLVLALIRSVQIFDEAYVLTGGGPGTSTLFLTQYIYETGFASLLRNPGLAAAASILMAGVLVVLTLAQLALSRRAERR